MNTVAIPRPETDNPEQVLGQRPPRTLPYPFPPKLATLIASLDRVHELKLAAIVNELDPASLRDVGTGAEHNQREDRASRAEHHVKEAERAIGEGRIHDAVKHEKEAINEVYKKP